MSLGKRRNHDYWGLVKQIGPHPQTKQDLKNTSSALGTGTTSMGRGGTEHAGHGNYEAEIRPYQLNGRLPPPKMSKWAQRSVVNKPLDVNMRKPVPGKKFGSIPSLLKGIAQTLNGIANRGKGADQGTVSSTPEEMSTNALNQSTQADMPELMVQTPTSTTSSQQLPDVVQIPSRIFGTQTAEVGSSEAGVQTAKVGRSEAGMQTDQRPVGIFNGSQTDISSEDMDMAERKFVELRAELARKAAEREELMERFTDLQTRFTGSVEERTVLENRLREALQRLDTEIPRLEEYRDLAETEIQRLQDEVGRPAYSPQTSSLGTQVTAPPDYGPQLSTTGVQAAKVARRRSSPDFAPRHRRRTIADVIQTATRQTSAGGSFVNAPGQMVGGAANRGKKANRNSINTQTPGAISVNPSVATRSSTR